MSKHLIILQHNSGRGGHGRLANQLWNFMSIYAYALERGLDLENHSFFEYAHLFRIPMRNPVIRGLFFMPFPLFERLLGHTRATILARKIYKLYVIAIRIVCRRLVLHSYNSPDIAGIFYLPPSEPVKEELLSLEQDGRVKTIYFDGWLFRNPAGIVKHRDEIVRYFKPKEETMDAITAFLAPIRTRYRHVIGVHIRQDDYKTFKGGRYFVEQHRIQQILDEYLRESGMDPAQTCFVITSNGPVETDLFSGLNIVVSDRSFIQDLFLLASCDAVVGSDSSFGNFAAYYGNIPHIVLTNAPLDWDYYRGKTTYFENQYCTLVHF